MKIILFLAAMLVAVTGFGSNADLLAELATGSGDAAQAAKDQIKYPALPQELPAETEARRTILKLIDKLKAEGKLTAELEAQLKAQVAEILAAEAQRIAALRNPPPVIVIER